MERMTGNSAKDFIEWLEAIRFLLPPKMTLTESRLLWERKIKEQEEIFNEVH